MSTFDMNNATDVALKMDVYAIYLRKSRADLEAEKLGEGEPQPGIEKYQKNQQHEKDSLLEKYMEKYMKNQNLEKLQMNDQVVLENQDMQNEENEE